MKKAKIAFWVILFGFIALILYQNRGFYLSQHSLGIDLVFFSYHTPEIPNAIVFLGFFFVGLLIAYFFSLVDRFSSRKTIKTLTANLDASEKMLDAQKMEIEALKGAKAGKPEPVEVAVEAEVGEKEPEDTDAS